VSMSEQLVVVGGGFERGQPVDVVRSY
jgi:hypothetical protein